MIPMGLAFGLVVVQTGFAWWWAPIFSLIIYAGSMEFLAVSLITAGVSPFSAALTCFLVNFRHLFYGLTHPRQNITTKTGRAYATYSLTDEVYAVVGSKPCDELAKFSSARLLTIHVVCQSLWAGPSLVGALLGLIIPPNLVGMGFALVALFVVLAWEAFRNNRDISLLITAVLFATVAALISPDHMLVLALAAYLAVLILRYRLPGLDRMLKGERI
ncbi:AzlC family ABC transporter permease [Corynebacterium caspium]|uniref:AzlC family ABC transporter permease n=1 Tax=Corynebacterium caspium TaxID=234828 RepID=UPI000A0636D1|nr:AzlC family ABC transporter permease [Corynebacterium caspium]